MKKIIIGAICSSLALIACNPIPIPDTLVRFVNTAQDSLGMKVFIEGKRISSDTPIAFKGAFPSLNTYQTVKAGTLVYSLCPDIFQDCPTIVKDKSVTLSGNTQTSLFLVGTSATNDDTGADARPLEVLSLGSDTATPASGKVKIRVLHAVTALSAKKVDLYILVPNAPLGGLALPLDYKNTSSYNTFDAGTYRISATLPGVTDPAYVKSEVLTLESGKTYTAVLVNPDINGIGVVLQTDK